jgi:hypothetical protein
LAGLVTILGVLAIVFRGHVQFGGDDDVMVNNRQRPSLVESRLAVAIGILFIAFGLYGMLVFWPRSS